MFIQLLISLVLQLAFCSITSAASGTVSDSKKINRVIYITLDGVRWQDIYLDHKYFPKFWQEYASKSIFYGVPSNDTTLHTASVPISLPSYQSQMAGAIQPCVDNQCGMIKVETFPEGIIKRLHVAKKDVATFSSWPEIAYAVEHIKGATYTNTGNKPVYDPEYLKADSVMKDLNQKQTLDHPRGHDRYDRYTFAQAWHYFDKYKPRFMWIALNDADEAAHAGNIQTYHQALAYYDGALDTVLKYLKERGIDKETMVIVTTDHGRGNGKNWTMHDPKFPESRQIWAFIINGQLVPATNEETKGHFSLLSIRPTVESALY